MNMRFGFCDEALFAPERVAQMTIDA